MWVFILPAPCGQTLLLVLIRIHCSTVFVQACVSVRNPTEQALCHSSIRLLGTLHKDKLENVIQKNRWTCNHTFALGKEIGTVANMP